MTTGGLTVRRISFDYPDDFEPSWNRRFPEFACAANSVSLLMPYAEPYFVASVRSALPRLDPDLAGETKDYLRQELAHQRAHRRFNDLVAARYGAVPRIERWMQRTYSWLGRTRSQAFNLAFAAGSETIAYGIARWSERHLDDLFAGADPEPATLFLWHLAEEVEHKSAAFEVWHALDGSRLRYALAMLLSFAILVWFTTIATLSMLAADRRLLHPVAWFRLLTWSVGLAFTVLPTMSASAMPGHHPSSFADPVYLPVWLRQYDPETGTLPLWESTGSTAATS